MIRLIRKLFKRKIKDYKRIFSYVSKYSSVLDTDNQTQTVSGYEDFIWQFWWQGKDNCPLIVKKCMESVAKFYPNKVIVIDKDNFSDYVDIPKYILDKVENGTIGLAHFSDILRLYLLTKYGGTWIDTTVYLTEKIPQEIISSKFFMFKSVTWALSPYIPTQKMLDVFEKISPCLDIDACSNWFIHSKPDNLILNIVKNFLKEYWKKEKYAINYFLFHYILTFVLINHKGCADIFNSMPNVNNRNPHLLSEMLQGEFDNDLFEEIKTYSSIHKLTYKNSKINSNLKYI